jgi:transposase
VAKWLREHPGVEIVSRDRAGPYAEGIKQGAPDAQQGASRWHLLANLSEAMKGFFLGKQAQIKALGHSPIKDLTEEEVKQLAPWQTSMESTWKRKAFSFTRNALNATNRSMTSLPKRSMSSLLRGR